MQTQPAHGLHSFCIQARQTISAMLSIASTLYIAAIHNITHSSTYTPSTIHHTTFHNPLHTTKTHKSSLCKRWQNDTRCRDVVKMLWCHSLVGFLGFHPYMCMFFNSENFFVTLYIGWSPNVKLQDSYTTVCYFSELWCTRQWYQHASYSMILPQP